MHRLVRAGQWQKLQVLESAYSHVFEQLKTAVAAGVVDAVDVPAMMRLEQQQRRLQRLLSTGLKETSDKLAIIEDAGKRLQNSSQVASALI